MSGLVFNPNDDNPPRSGFLDKNEILKYVTEEDIYSLVFGYKPEEFDKVCSPLRADFSPGAWFERNPYKDNLLFIDFADTNRTHRDCFNVVQEYFNLPNFYQTLIFIENTLIKGQDLPERQLSVFSNMVRDRQETLIFFERRDYLISDKYFWEKYGITKQQLIDDKVIPVNKYKIINPRKGTYLANAYTLCYAYTDFENHHKKLYFPYRKGSKRFLSNCDRNDIGGIKSLDYEDSTLIISKSYKDWRVLKNLGYNTVWFQNEGSLPSEKTLSSLITFFPDVIVFYDNDETGINSSIKIRDQIQGYYPHHRVSNLYLPEYLLEENIKDPSDLYANKGIEELTNFLTSNI